VSLFHRHQWAFVSHQCMRFERGWPETRILWVCQQPGCVANKTTVVEGTWTRKELLAGVES
jgi:hypothetical protein